MQFSHALKSWRQVRRVSQLGLAVEAEVSARHIAFLETGRALPSRGMVLRLAEALDIPRPERNALLTAAGFAAHYPDLPPGASDLAAVRDAMDWTVSRHAPWPALVMDRLWTIIRLNAPAAQLFGAVGLGEGASLLDAISTPGLGASVIENWDEVGHHTLLRLRAQSARAGGLPALDRAAAALARDPAVAAWSLPERPVVVVPTIWRAGSQRLSMFSTYAQFSTAEETNVAEMQIELMFPADAATETALRAMEAAAPGA